MYIYLCCSTKPDEKFYDYDVKVFKNIGDLITKYNPFYEFGICVDNTSVTDKMIIKNIYKFYLEFTFDGHMCDTNAQYHPINYFHFIQYYGTSEYYRKYNVR